MFCLPACFSFCTSCYVNIQIIPEHALTAESSPDGIVDEDLISPDLARKAHSMMPNGNFGPDFEPTEVRYDSIRNWEDSIIRQTFHFRFSKQKV